MKRVDWLVWPLLFFVAGGAVGWNTRGLAEAKERKEIAEMMNRCGHCFACRGGYRWACDALEAEGFAPQVCGPAAIKAPAPEGRSL